MNTYYWSFVRIIHGWPVNSVRNGSVTRRYCAFFLVSMSLWLNKLSNAKWHHCNEIKHIRSNWPKHPSLSTLVNVSTLNSGDVSKAERRRQCMLVKLQAMVSEVDRYDSIAQGTVGPDCNSFSFQKNIFSVSRPVKVETMYWFLGDVERKFRIKILYSSATLLTFLLPSNILNHSGGHNMYPVITLNPNFWYQPLHFPVTPMTWWK